MQRRWLPNKAVAFLVQGAPQPEFVGERKNGRALPLINAPPITPEYWGEV